MNILQACDNLSQAFYGDKDQEQQKLLVQK